MDEVVDKAKISRFCEHCLCEWEQQVTREELRTLVQGKPISACPDCGLLT